MAHKHGPPRISMSVSPEALPSNSGYHPALGPHGDPLGTTWDPALLGVKPRKEPDIPIGWRENGRNTRLFLVANAKKIGDGY